MAREIWIVSNFPPPVHGVSAFNHALSRYLRESGHTVREYPIGTRGALSSLEHFGIGKVGNDLLTLARVSGSAATRLVAKGNETTIYFTPSQIGISVFRDFLTVLASFPIRPRIVAHLHGCRWLDTWAQGGLIAKTMHATLASCDRVIVLGSSYAKRMRVEAGLSNVVGIDNGVTVASDPSSRFVARSVSDVPRLLFISNYLRAKGVWVVVAAARALKERGVRFHMTLAGEWYLASERTEFYEEWGTWLQQANDCVEILPFADADRKRELLESSTIFMLPTLNPCEGQPLSLIEAMAYGLVPLTTPNGGIPDLFDFENSASMCRTEHETGKGLADTIQYLIENPSQLAEWSRQAHAKQQRDLTFERCANLVTAELLGPPSLRVDQLSSR